MYSIFCFHVGTFQCHMALLYFCSIDDSQVFSKKTNGNTHLSLDGCVCMLMYSVSAPADALRLQTDVISLVSVTDRGYKVIIIYIYDYSVMYSFNLDNMQLNHCL